MKRSLLSRVTVIVMGLWFVAMSAAPEVMHACPTHGAHATVSPSSSDHTAMPLPAAEHHPVSERESAPQHGDQCTCLGQCCAATSVAFISSNIALADVVTTATRDAGLPDHEYVPVSVEHLLPLAQAPPQSA